MRERERARGLVGVPHCPVLPVDLITIDDLNCFGFGGLPYVFFFFLPPVHLCGGREAAGPNEGDPSLL